MLRGLKKELAFTRFQRVNAQTSFFIFPGIARKNRDSAHLIERHYWRCPVGGSSPYPSALAAGTETDKIAELIRSTPAGACRPRRRALGPMDPPG